LGHSRFRQEPNFARIAPLGGIADDLAFDREFLGSSALERDPDSPRDIGAILEFGAEILRAQAALIGLAEIDSDEAAIAIQFGLDGIAQILEGGAVESGNFHHHSPHRMGLWPLGMMPSSGRAIRARPPGGSFSVKPEWKGEISPPILSGNRLSLGGADRLGD